MHYFIAKCDMTEKEKKSENKSALNFQRTFK